MRVLRILHRFGVAIVALVVALVALPLASAAAKPTPPPPDHLAVTAPSAVVSNVPFSFTVEAVDSSGKVVPTYAGTVHFTSTDPSANVKLPSDGLLPDGEATLSATLVTGGRWTITAADTKDDAITGTSDSIFVETQGGATHFSVSAPFSVTPGAGFTFTVRALTSGNSVATGYNGVVAFAASDQYATVPAPVQVTNGQGTFSAVLRSTGYQSITAIDYTFSLSGTSNSIAVGPPWAATHFSVVAPTAVTAGVPFTVTVTALDWYGNVVTGYGGWVRFASTDALATLPTTTWWYYGSASFTVTLRTVGSELVTATDTGYPGISGVSNTILVVAPPVPAPSTVVPTQSPDQRYVGQLYQDLLGRPVDPTGLAFWTGALASGVPRAQVAASIMASPEYMQSVVTGAYVDTLERNADPTGFYLSVQALANGASDEALEAGMIGSDEYYAMHGSNLYDWTVAAYQDVLGRSPDPAGLAFWMSQALKGVSRTQIAAALMASGEYQVHLVTELYTSLLGRSPAAWEVASWVQVLANGASDEQVMVAFASSPEYYMHAM